MKGFEIPTISLQQIVSLDNDIMLIKNDPSNSEQVVDSLRHACKEIGFFYLKVESEQLSHDLISSVFHQSKQFFNLPMSIKQSFTDAELNRGYTSMGEETLDPSKQSEGDTKEGYYIARDVPRDSDMYNPSKLSGPNVWPTNTTNNELSGGVDTIHESVNLDCTQWKDVMNEYFEQMNTIAFQVVQSISLAIGLPKNYFDDKFSPPMAFLRLLHYSKQKSDISNGIYACGAHSDYGMITLLATDDQPGLQILVNSENDNKKEGEECWVDVAPPPLGTFVVNLGDMLERWTNGRFKSTVHRVISSGEQERYSIPFFYEPNFDTVVKCLDVCLDDGEVPKYPQTTAGGHLLEKYNQTHADFQS